MAVVELDVAAFRKDMEEIAKRVEGIGNKAVRIIALSIEQKLTMITPVDTGAARRNWLVGSGSPRLTAVPAPASAGSAIAEATADAMRVIAQHKGKPDESPIYITNNLPYINRLNQGWSKQAPVGFVEKAIADGQAAVQKRLEGLLDGGE